MIDFKIQTFRVAAQSAAVGAEVPVKTTLPSCALVLEIGSLVTPWIRNGWQQTPCLLKNTRFLVYERLSHGMFMLGKVHWAYLSLLNFIGHPLAKRKRSKKRYSECDADETSLMLLDERATELGNRYRGMGILIGLFGAVVIFFALAPIGLRLNEHQAHLMNYAELFLMVISICCLLYVRFSRLHDRWLIARLNAEKLRYAPLIEGKRGTQDIAKSLTLLLEDQIKYNKLRAKDYKAVEEASTVLTVFIFFSAFTAAIGHMFFSYEWLILITAFLPTLGATVHGINRFLGLSQLESEHESMSEKLGEQLKRAQLLDPAADQEQWQEASSIVYGLLTGTTDNWTHIARKQTIKLG